MSSNHPLSIHQQPLAQLASKLQKRLPENPFLINLCDNRLWFAAGLAATFGKRQTTLLPPANTPGVITELLNLFPEAIALTDREQDLPCPKLNISSLMEPVNCGRHGFGSSIPTLDLIAFTSGSSGKPQPWRKSWPMLAHCARLALSSLGLARQSLAVIGTTPPQHMYGLETSVIWPLCSKLVLTDQKPFYPEDIRLTMEKSSLPVLLATTPMHLKACIDEVHRWHNLAAVISSTAALDPELAETFEDKTGKPLWELYGSTETQSFAYRRPAREPLWRLYPGTTLQQRGMVFSLRAPWLPKPVELADAFKLCGEGKFQVVGRRSDLVKIAGKRISLAELNLHLTRINGVRDGCFYQTNHQRLGALVVTSRSKAEILTALRQVIDEVFLPRPLYQVEKIPRNATGKLVKSELEKLLATLSPSNLL